MVINLFESAGMPYQRIPSHFQPWRTRCTTFAMAPSGGTYTTSYLMTIVMFALSLNIYEIFTDQQKCQKFDLENEGQSQGREKRNLCHSTGYVRFHTSEFLRGLAT